ncbi:hypothetical protein UJ101_02028 [Flavobacteriaceae bacterium UJ101]|nr:hypothetical protein UJ101_02028 [Flavobacteriaceae bacterium UJ101]
MKIDFIPFLIGMHYEYWEFDLEPINSEFNVPYDDYIYFKRDITELFGISVQGIILSFSWDILHKVEIRFKPKKTIQQFIDLSGILEKKYGRQILKYNKKSTILEKIWTDPKKYLILQYHLKSNTLTLRSKEYLNI